MVDQLRGDAYSNPTYPGVLKLNVISFSIYPPKTFSKPFSMVTVYCVFLAKLLLGVNINCFLSEERDILPSTCGEILTLSFKVSSFRATSKLITKGSLLDRYPLSLLKFLIPGAGAVLKVN